MGNAAARNVCQVHAEAPSNPFEFNDDVLRTVLSFVDGIYISVASVSTRWRDTWGQRPTVTNVEWAVQSCSCLDWAKACGLRIRNGPCLRAAAEGRLDVLQHAVTLGYSREGMPICEHAAGAGHLKVVKWCRTNGYPWGRSSERAAEGGHLEVLKWHGMEVRISDTRTPQPLARELQNLDYLRFQLHEISFRGYVGLMEVAAEKGQQRVLEWCMERDHKWPQMTCYLAAKGGHFELLRWLRANGCPWSPLTMNAAAEAEDLEMLHWCRVNDCPWHPSIHNTAARRGKLEILKWSIANDPSGRRPWLTCFDAAAYGHLGIVQWLRAEGFPWGQWCCYSAASGGHFEVLKWCIANGCPWDSTSWRPRDTFEGSVPMMIWAIANGCPWISFEADLRRICKHAAAAGNLDILLWCNTFQVLHVPSVSAAAALHGHVKILEWLRAKGGLSKACAEICLCDEAAKGGSLEVMKWCRANGFPWDERTCNIAAKSGNLELLQWCKANGCPWYKRTCRHAAERGNLEMLAWCRKNGCPWDWFAYHDADLHAFEEVAKWCRVHGCPRRPPRG